MGNIFASCKDPRSLKIPKTDDIQNKIKDQAKQAAPTPPKVPDGVDIDTGISKDGVKVKANAGDKEIGGGVKKGKDGKMETTVEAKSGDTEVSAAMKDGMNH